MEASRERESKGGTDGVRDTPGRGSSMYTSLGNEHWRVVTPNGYRTVRVKRKKWKKLKGILSGFPHPHTEMLRNLAKCRSRIQDSFRRGWVAYVLLTVNLHEKGQEELETKFSFLWGGVWRRQWHPTPVLLPRKSHGRRSLVGCSPWVARVRHD